MSANTTALAASHPRPTLTVKEAAELLGVSRWLVLQQISQGNLPHRRFGRRILISRSRFMAWLEDPAVASGMTANCSDPAQPPSSARPDEDDDEQYSL